MPRKQTYTITEETCFPCKYWAQILWVSGLDPVYHRYCQHPSKMGHYKGVFRDQGAIISADSDARPQWCPIRGDAKAEQEAMED